MGFTAFTLGKALQDIKDECWVALHFDDPELAGAYASEINGGGYDRRPANFGEITNNHMWVTNNLRWEGLTLNLVAYLGGWDKHHNGNLQWTSELQPPQRILEGKGFVVPSDTIALSFSSLT